MMILTFL